MRLAFSSNAYMRYPFREAARRVAALGYGGIEIMADVPHAWPAGLLPQHKQELRQALDDFQLEISNLNAFMMNAVADRRQPYWHPSWIEPDPHYRCVRIDHTIRALELARELGAAHITTEPGGPLTAGQDRRRAFELFVESLRPAVQCAERCGVMLLVEPEPGLLIENAVHFEEFMAYVDSPAVGLNFDVGHFYCVGDDPAAAIVRLARWVRHVHLEDIAADRVHQHLVPGRGAIDFRSIFAALQNIGYAGWITIELYPYIEDPDAAAAAAHAYVEPLLSQP